MASKDRPRSERKKRNDTELHEKQAEKKEKRRARKQALKDLKRKAKRNPKSLPPA